MTRFRKIYLEISNLCNLKCRFCAGTDRKGKRLSIDEMKILLPKLRPWSDYLYFHLMGEPLGHPDLDTFLHMAGQEEFKVILTTNGTLLSQKQEILLSSDALHKVNISLHAFEANDLRVSFEEYLRGCFSFGKAAEGSGIITVFRLWNHGGEEKRNREILELMKKFFPEPWVKERRGTRIGNRVYLEYGEKFDWPDKKAQIREDIDRKVFCYGLRDQIGVLCDGTVVPCCLDHEGDIALGNLFQQSMEEIVSSERARRLLKGFEKGICEEELCKHCGYAVRFTK